MKDLTLKQDLRKLLSETFGVDYETEAYNEASEGGKDCDVMLEPSTGKLSFVQQGWGQAFERQNFDYKCIAKYVNVRWEEDLETIIENYFN